jgi:hypothetical protein
MSELAADTTATTCTTQNEGPSLDESLEAGAVPSSRQRRSPRSCNLTCNLRASPAASPKAVPKGIWGAPDKKSFQPRATKVLSVRRGPIRCSAPRACPRYTGDASGTPDTTKCEARRRGPDASTNGRSTATYLAMVQLPGRGTVTLATASIDARTAGM